jgi:hypothetical protein
MILIGAVNGAHSSLSLWERVRVRAYWKRHTSSICVTAFQALSPALCQSEKKKTANSDAI